MFHVQSTARVAWHKSGIELLNPIITSYCIWDCTSFPESLSLWVDISGQSTKSKMWWRWVLPWCYPGGALLLDVGPSPSHGLVGAHCLHHCFTLGTDLGPVGHITILLTWQNSWRLLSPWRTSWQLLSPWKTSWQLLSSSRTTSVWHRFRFIVFRKKSSQNFL